MKNKEVLALGALAVSGDLQGLRKSLGEHLNNATGVHWQRDLGKIHTWLSAPGPLDPKAAPFAIFGIGNSKLPFVTYSELPLVTCPGKGECEKWCYSLKALRYPAASMRMLQNTILGTMFESDSVVQEHYRKSLSTLAAKVQHKQGEDESVDFRLFVDGDFRSGASVTAWFTLLDLVPQVKAYGYSKSFEEILAAYRARPLPLGEPRYTLNLSSGGVTEAPSELQGLSWVRGNFIATDTGDTKEHRARTGNKAFSCPGKCGSCVTRLGKNVHACGDSMFRDIDIIIAAH